jgi:hypothetical protein
LSFHFDAELLHGQIVAAVSGLAQVALDHKPEFVREQGGELTLTSRALVSFSLAIHATIRAD